MANLDPRMTPLVDRGCTSCVFDPHVFITHPRTGDVLDTFYVNVCDRGVTLRLAASLALSDLNRGVTTDTSTFDAAVTRYFAHTG